MTKIKSNILEVVGDTPIVQLQRIAAKDIALYAKLESNNPAGSMKDRTSKFIISELLRTGQVQQGGTIVESSSGNMAIGLAQACLYYGLKLIVVVDPNINPQTIKILKAYKVEIVKVQYPKENGGFLAARLEMVHHIVQHTPGSVWSNQYNNPNNPKAHHQTMTEIMDCFQNELDYLFVATSTCGTLMGCADFIAHHQLKTKLVAVDAQGSVLFGKKKGERKIPGHGAGVPSNFLDINKVDKVLHVSDYECVKGCRTLLEKEAMLCGGSSGGLLTAFHKFQNEIPKASKVLLLFADRGERYLDTVYNDHWVQKNINTVSYQTSSKEVISLSA